MPSWPSCNDHFISRSPGNSWRAQVSPDGKPVFAPQSTGCPLIDRLAPFRVVEPLTAATTWATAWGEADGHSVPLGVHPFSQPLSPAIDPTVVVPCRFDAVLPVEFVSLLSNDGGTGPAPVMPMSGFKASKMCAA